ncbi:MAG: hypothetical protein M3388_02860 [Acidobacteriota bacterium]|nr:hypothetical protein [Acidobacteriota bacterium]
MQLFPISGFLRWVFLADAATCLTTGLLMAIGAGLLEQLLGLPPELLFYAGIGLLPFAAFLIYLATRKNLSSAAVWTVIVLNILWTADSFTLLLSGWVAPTTIGYSFVVFQACGVAIFAALEYFGLRRSTKIATDF